MFVCLPDGRTLVEDGPGDAVECARRTLADEIAPPYRAVARPRERGTWAVGAVAIEVAELPAELRGEELTLVAGEDGSRSLTLDGRPESVGMQALERIAGGRFDAYVLQAARLAADLWEVRVDPV